MDIKQLEQKIIEADKRGATKEEMEQLKSFYTDALKSQGSAAKGAKESPLSQKDIPFFPDTLARDVARPFLGAFASVANLTKAGTDDFDRVRREGMNFGYFGNVKPLGAEFDVTKGLKENIRPLAEATGRVAEMASYGFAPLKGIKGAGFFDAAFKQGAPFSVAFGAGKGLQKYGEEADESGKRATAGEAALAGAGAYLGSSLGYGITAKGAQLIGHFGARALQQPAVKAAGEQIRSLAEKVWSAMPDSFQQQGFKMADAILNASTRRKVAALESEYLRTHGESVSSWIRSVAPDVGDPELSLASFQRKLKESIGRRYRDSEALYNDVKAAEPLTSSVERWTNSVSKIDSAISALPFSNAKFELMGIRDMLKKQITPRQILDANFDLLDKAATAETREEAKMFREVADSLFSDMRRILEVDSPAILDTWDRAYQRWLQAGQIYESPVISGLKTAGSVEKIIDDSLLNKLDTSERGLILESIADDPEPFRELIISSLLSKAEREGPEKGAKTIQDFLSSWERNVDGKVVNELLSPDQAALLDDLSNYMGENFGDFVSGMRKAIGMDDEAVRALSEQRSTLDIAKMVDDGDFEAIAKHWVDMSGKDEFAQALSVLSPEEKRVVGLTIWRDLFNDELPVFRLNDDGTINAENLAEAFRKGFQELNKLGGSKKSIELPDGTKSTIEEMLYSKEQIESMKEAEKMISTLENVRKLPVGEFKRIMHAGLAFIYGSLGGKYIGATARHAAEAAAPTPKAFYEAVNSLVDSALLKKNGMLKMEDVLRSLVPFTGAVGGHAPGGLTD